LRGKTSNHDLEAENRREHFGLRMEQRCRTQVHPTMTWIPIAALSAYICAGALIMATPSARRVMRRECAGVAGPIHPLSPCPTYPLWKIIAFFTLVYAGALLAWPLFVRSWFPQKIHVPEPKPDVPNDWLVRRLSDEEIALQRPRFRTRMQVGDEVWEFNSPAHFWEHLAGRAGIALVRNGEVLDSIITSMN
jgi:hypothetical protein